MARIDDDLRLRYLQAQRVVRASVGQEAMDSFVPHDVEKELGIYHRLRDDEAFEDWLSLGITTTVESTLADAEAREREERERKEAEAKAKQEEAYFEPPDPWSEFRLLMVRKIRSGHIKRPSMGGAAAVTSTDNIVQLQSQESVITEPPPEIVDSKAAEEFAVTVIVAEQTLHALEQKLDAVVRDKADCTLVQLCGKLEDLIHDVEALPFPPQGLTLTWTAFDPRPLFLLPEMAHRAQALRVVAEEVSEAFVAATIDLDTVRTRLMDAQAPDEDAAMTREVLAAQAVDMEQRLYEVGDLTLRLNFLRLSCERFESESVRSLQIIQTGVSELQQSLEDIVAKQVFSKRRDVLDERAEELSLHAAVIVGHIDALLNIPLDLQSHRQWQSKLADFALSALQGCSAMFLSLFASEVQIESSGERSALRIKSWVVQEGLSLPEVAFRSARQESLRLGLALCCHARHTLKESARMYDSVWGFTYW